MYIINDIHNQRIKVYTLAQEIHTCWQLLLTPVGWQTHSVTSAQWAMSYLRLLTQLCNN